MTADKFRHSITVVRTEVGKHNVLRRLKRRLVVRFTTEQTVKLAREPEINNAVKSPYRQFVRKMRTHKFKLRTVQLCEFAVEYIVTVYGIFGKIKRNT